MKEKIAAFAKLVEEQQLARLTAESLDCEANVKNHKVTVGKGHKYTRVDIGNSGRFMVENSTGNIFGTKGYGVPHKGHFYGTLDTTNDFNWGDYYPVRKTNPTPLDGGIPKLTFAPQPVATA